MGWCRPRNLLAQRRLLRRNHIRGLPQVAPQAFASPNGTVFVPLYMTGNDFYTSYFERPWAAAVHHCPDDDRPAIFKTLEVIPYFLGYFRHLLGKACPTSHTSLRSIIHYELLCTVYDTLKIIMRNASEIHAVELVIPLL